MQAYDKLINAVKHKNSILCVGIDPVLDKLPLHYPKTVDAMLDFCKKIIDSTADYASAMKVNFAFFEQYGVEGFKALEETIHAIPDDIFIVADAKRGDIANTSIAYAKSVFDTLKCDSVTVNPYMGYDSVQPFLDYKDKMIFVLALTSNKGSNDFQRLISDGKPIYDHVIRTSMKWSDERQIGYVVGATHPNDLSEIRKLVKSNVLLIPGVGVQGGDVEQIIKANNNGPAIINSSRAINYASSGSDFAEAASELAKLTRDKFNKYR